MAPFDDNEAYYLTLRIASRGGLMEYVRVVRVIPFSIGEVWGLVAGFGARRRGVPA